MRAEKAEEEVAELVKKSQQLETELDITHERLSIVTMQLEEKEKALMAAEAEVNALNRRVQGLEEDLEKTEERWVVIFSEIIFKQSVCMSICLPLSQGVLINRSLDYQVLVLYIVLFFQLA